MLNKTIRSILQKPFFIQLLHWEYWSFNTLYFFLYPIFIWYGVKAKSFFFFSASNPSITNGGFLMESKKDIDAILPNAYKPTTLFFTIGTDITTILQEMDKYHIGFPIIIKPNVGERGRGVKKIDSPVALQQVLPLYTVSFIIQPFVYYPKEIGLFYVRMPNSNVGNITGIVRKEFMQVTGDGKQTILELLQQNERYILQLPTLKKLIPERLSIVLPKNVTEQILPYGNHARGCLFIDDSHLVTPELEAVFNKVCLQINGFYYGRLDIKYNSWEELLQGKNFSIIELNGAGSEPTHIYDPKHSIFFAWKEIVRHWKLMYTIAQMNHQNGIAFLSFKDGMQMFKDSSVHGKKLDALII